MVSYLRNNQVVSWLGDEPVTMSRESSVPSTSESSDFMALWYKLVTNFNLTLTNH